MSQLTLASYGIYAKSKKKRPTKAKIILFSNELEFLSNKCLYMEKNVCLQM